MCGRSRLGITPSAKFCGVSPQKSILLLRYFTTISRPLIKALPFKINKLLLFFYFNFFKFLAMFYAQFVLAKKGALGQIWLAAHWERKLNREQVLAPNLDDAVDEILRPKVNLKFVF